MIDMRHRLDQRQAELALADWAAIEDVEAADRRARPGSQCLGQAGQRGPMVVDQLRQARRQTGERQLVARQDQWWRGSASASIFVQLSSHSPTGSASGSVG